MGIGERAFADGVEVAGLGREPETRSGDEAAKVEIEVLGKAEATVVVDALRDEELPPEDRLQEAVADPRVAPIRQVADEKAGGVDPAVAHGGGPAAA